MNEEIVKEHIHGFASCTINKGKIVATQFPLSFQRGASTFPNKNILCALAEMTG